MCQLWVRSLSQLHVYPFTFIWWGMFLQIRNLNKISTHKQGLRLVTTLKCCSHNILSTLSVRNSRLDSLLLLISEFLKESVEDCITLVTGWLNLLFLLAAGKFCGSTLKCSIVPQFSIYGHDLKSCNKRYSQNYVSNTGPTWWELRTLDGRTCMEHNV
jgi:hypothetical protein